MQNVQTMRVSFRQAWKHCGMRGGDGSIWRMDGLKPLAEDRTRATLTVSRIYKGKPFSIDKVIGYDDAVSIATPADEMNMIGTPVLYKGADGLYRAPIYSGDSLTAHLALVHGRCLYADDVTVEEGDAEPMQQELHETLHYLGGYYLGHPHSHDAAVGNVEVAFATTTTEENEEY